MAASILHKSKHLRCYGKGEHKRKLIISKIEPVSESFAKTNIQEEIHAICSVLKDRCWDDDIEEMLKNVIVGKLTTIHVQETLKQIKNIHTSVGFFIWAGKQVGFRHNSVTYHSILKLVGYAEEFQFLEKLLLAMRSDKCKLNTTTFNIVISSYGKAGLTRKAWSTFAKMRAFRCIPDTLTYNALMNAYVKKGAWNRVKELYSQMFEVGPSPDSYTFNTLVDGLLKAKMMNDASLMLREMVINGYTPSVVSYNTLMEGLCVEDKVDEACILMGNMMRNGCIPTVITYNILINGMSKVGRMADARIIVHLMQEIGCFPNVHTYTIIMNGCMKTHETNEAWSTFLEMKKRECVPDIITYGVLMDGFYKADKLEAGFELMVETLASKIPLNTVVYTMLLDCLCKTNKADLAHTILDDMLCNRCIPDLITYRALINGLSKSGKFSKTYEVMIELIKYTSSTLDIANIKALIDGLCKGGYIKEAMECFNGLPHNKIVPDIILYKVIIGSAYRKDWLEDAYTVMKAMMRTGFYPNAKFFHDMILGYCEQGKFDMANKVLEDMMLNEKIFPIDSSKDWDYNENDFCSAITLLHTSMDRVPPQQILSFVEAFLYLCQCGAFSLAIKLLEKMMTHEFFKPMSGGMRILHTWLSHGELHKVMIALSGLRTQGKMSV